MCLISHRWVACSILYSLSSRDLKSRFVSYRFSSDFSLSRFDTILWLIWIETISVMLHVWVISCVFSGDCPRSLWKRLMEISISNFDAFSLISWLVYQVLLAVIRNIHGCVEAIWVSHCFVYSVVVFLGVLELRVHTNSCDWYMSRLHLSWRMLYCLVYVLLSIWLVCHHMNVFIWILIHREYIWGVVLSSRYWLPCSCLVWCWCHNRVLYRHVVVGLLLMIELILVHIS